MYFQSDGKLVINVSDVCAYEWYLRNQYRGEAALDGLIARLTRRNDPTQGMELEAAFHESYNVVADFHESWRNPDSKLRRSNFEQRYAGKLWRFRARELGGVTTLCPERGRHFVSNEYDFDGRSVKLRGKIDARAGNTLIEYMVTVDHDLVFPKPGGLTTNDIDNIDQLEQSFRWRAYLSMHKRCSKLRYDVFHIIQLGGRAFMGEDVESAMMRIRRGDDPFEQRECFSVRSAGSNYYSGKRPFYTVESVNQQLNSETEVPNLIINGHRVVTFDRYPSLEGEVCDRLSKFVAFCEDLNRGCLP